MSTDAPRVRPVRHHGDHANPGAVLARRHAAQRAAEEVREKALAADVAAEKAELGTYSQQRLRDLQAYAAEHGDEALERAAREQQADNVARWQRQAERIATPSRKRARQ